MKNKMQLTNSEKEVMDLLWDYGEPLTSTEIVKLCQNRNWKPSYIHIMINSLLSKEFIHVAGFKKTTKNYARTFEPSISKDKWAMSFIKTEKRDSKKILFMILDELLQNTNDLEILNELYIIIQNRQNELNHSKE